VLAYVYVVVVVVSVSLSVCESVSCYFLSLLVFWWLCVCLPVSGFCLLRGAFSFVIEACGVFVFWYCLLGCVCAVCVLFYCGLLVFVCDDSACWLCFA